MTHDELINHPIARSRGLIVNAPDGGLTTGVLPRMPAGWLRHISPGGLVGADAASVVEQFGLSNHCDKMVSSGAVVDVA